MPNEEYSVQVAAVVEASSHEMTAVLMLQSAIGDYHAWVVDCGFSKWDLQFTGYRPRVFECAGSFRKRKREGT